MTDLTPVYDFLGCTTPQAWLDEAVQQIPLLMIDHAHCEKKAAATAMNLLYRYVDRQDLLQKLAQLAREELLHFEQVIAMIRDKGVSYDHLSPSRYAGALREAVKSHEPDKLIDTLIVGAFIEARSCERFCALADRLERDGEHADLVRYYRFLLKSESRHFEDYLELARRYAPHPIDQRIAQFRQLEASLITSADALFRFHSGVPVAA
jgi:tRNA-(ms[2]io[6]A)-hydroxylase